MASEKWKYPVDKERLIKILPINEIESVLGENPNISILFDDEVKSFKALDYNMSIATRAFNDNMESRLKKYYENFHDKNEFADLMKIRLPQILWKDNLGLERTIIGLHVSKLRKDELFINDIVLTRNEELDGIKNGIFDIVLDNLIKFAKEQDLKYISGHAANLKVYKIFVTKGFKADTRTQFRNLELWNKSKVNGQQVPFYMEI